MTMTHPTRTPRRPQALKVLQAALLLVAGLLGAASPAQAWWNEDWGQRTRYALDTTDKGQPIAEALTECANFPCAAGVPVHFREK